ncbi:MAG: GDSL-type esterase/lipase family protein, partial [Cyanobacteria bacterium P01_F01_bin.53]
GYIADTGLGYNNARGYGWVTQNTAGAANVTPLDLRSATRDRNAAGTEQSLDTLIHLQRPGLAGGWEYNIANGDYLVRVALGDASYFDSRHLLRIENEVFASSFTPSAGEPFSVVTGQVTVTDGRLSLDAIGGENTKINYLEIEAVSSEQTDDTTGDTTDDTTGDTTDDTTGDTTDDTTGDTTGDGDTTDDGDTTGNGDTTGDTTGDGDTTDDTTGDTTDDTTGDTTGDTTDDIDSLIEPIRINFQSNGAPVPQGFTADTGLGYDNARGYGWVTQNTVGQANVTPLNLRSAARDRNAAGTEQSLDTLIHLQRPGLAGGWEHNIANGDYLVRVALGDASYFDSRHLLRIENQVFAPSFTPDATSPFSVVTGVVSVTDGRLSVDAIGGDNTKINYIEIEAIAAGQPTLGGAFDGTSELVNGERDVATDASFSFGINAQSSTDVVEASSVTIETVKLVRTADGAVVAGTANTTGGRDSISFTPDAPLSPNTQYTLLVDGVTNEAGAEFVPASRTFTTGGNANDGNNGGGTTGPNPITEGIMFDRSSAFSGSLLSSVVVSPDNQKLYAATLNGLIRRWDIDQTTGALSNQQTFDIGGSNGPRAIIGIEFDPTNPSRLWFSHNDTIFQAPAANFTGKLSYLDLGEGDAFTAEVTDYVTGLPRSIRDHLSNSIEFGPDGSLYLTQGSNSAQGRADNAWGNREENLLTAAILKIDPNRTPPAGGFDVQTEDGGNYDPFADNAPVTLYATGTRNAYDLVWHSNGQLYVPTNGSAAGGNTPDDPTTATNEGLQNVVIQSDYLYRVEEGGYYGHPNPSRGEYVLNGGNPTTGVEPAEVAASGGRRGYEVGIQPDDNYRGFAFDFGFNRSPNGSIEYRSNAFNDQLSGRLLVTEYSGGDQIRSLTFDANGNVTGDDVIATGFNNPLDLIEHTPSGRLYVVDDGGITLLTPEVPPTSLNGDTDNDTVGGDDSGNDAINDVFTELPLVDSNNNQRIEILPLGDSLTRGEDAVTDVALSNGYRDNLQALLRSNNIDFDFLGSRNHGEASSEFDTDHDGFGGSRIGGIADRVANGLLDNIQPEVILLTLGTNDLRSTGTGINVLLNQLGNLIDNIKAIAPLSNLIVSSVPPVNTAVNGISATFADRVEQFNQGLPGLVASRVGQQVSFVDAFGSLNATSDLSGDGFHPNETGYGKTALAFFDAIDTVLTEGGLRLTGTSNNDVLTGGPNNDVLMGLAGNDLLSGGINETSAQIDVLNGGGGNDTFVVGDSYSNAGDQDYALLQSFDTATDTIRLGAGSYQLANTASTLLPTGAGIYEGSELLAIVEGSTAEQLDINADYFTT